MSVTMEKVTIELEERITQSINLRDTETEEELYQIVEQSFEFEFVL